MRRGILVVGVTLTLLGAYLAFLAPAVSAATARPITSGIDLTLNVGHVFAPGETVDVHFWVTNNGTLVDPTWPDPWPHLHPPDLLTNPDATLIILEKPVPFGHAGAFRVSFPAPGVPGLHAVHGAAEVGSGGVRVFGYESFTVVPGEIAAVAQMSLFWSIAAFVVSVITLAIVIVIAARKGYPRRPPS